MMSGKPRCACGQFSKEGHVCGKPGRKAADTAKWRGRSEASLAARAKYAREWRKANRERVREGHKRSRDAVKLAALKHYGGDPPACACCGETLLEFLTIDHIGGGGGAHRRALGFKGGARFCYWLRAQGWPEGYRVRWCGDAAWSSRAGGG